MTSEMSVYVVGAVFAWKNILINDVLIVSAIWKINIFGSKSSFPHEMLLQGHLTDVLILMLREMPGCCTNMKFFQQN